MCFLCSKEPSHRDGSLEYPQHMFWSMNKKKINFQLRTLIWMSAYQYMFAESYQRMHTFSYIRIKHVKPSYTVGSDKLTLRQRKSVYFCLLFSLNKCFGCSKRIDSVRRFF